MIPEVAFDADESSKAIKALVEEQAKRNKITQDVGEASKITKDDNWDGYDRKEHPERFGKIKAGGDRGMASRDGSTRGGEIEGTPRSDNEGKAEGNWRG